jgi:hypothetical protein
MQRQIRGDIYFAVALCVVRWYIVEEKVMEKVVG